MATVIISEFMDEEAVATLRPDFGVLYDPQLVDRPDELRARLAQCRGLIVRNRTQVDAALLDAAPRLEVVGRLGVGLDNIDLAACRARRIPVFPATGTNDETVAEFTIGAILMLARGGAYHVTGDVLEGRWPRTRIKGRDVKGMHLGLLGFGAVARQVAVRARAFGMRLAAHDPLVSAGHPAWEELGVTSCTLDELLERSQVLSLHVPLTSATRGILDDARLRKLPPGAYVINTARGGLICERSLAEALRESRIGGAFLDVVEDEPLAAGSALAGAPNLHLSPHVAGITRESVLRASMLTVENVRNALQGKPATVPNAAAWED
ncbi:MAG: hydroxyacid dehydrogenase [Hyphomicrobiaceae bacterium]|nr:hydroxyacid dehydrogenase [Hyphomicrobiaceae bacterium]